MKRLIYLILTILIIFSISACSNNIVSSSDTSSKNQGPTITQTDSYYGYFSNEKYPYGQREEHLSSLECGTASRMVYYRGWGQKPPENTTIKVGEEHTFSLWTYPHHHFCGGYEYIIEDGSVLKIASSDWDGMYDEPIPKVLFQQCTVVGVKPGKTTLTYKVTSAEGTESVTFNITVVE